MQSHELPEDGACAAAADGSGWLHFAGVAGTGMSALAQFHALQARRTGGLATGSDRAFDRGEQAQIRRQLEELGVQILPQTAEVWTAGGGPSPAGGRTCSAVVTAPRWKTPSGTWPPPGRWGSPSCIGPNCWPATSRSTGRLRSPGPAASPPSRR